MPEITSTTKLKEYSEIEAEQDDRETVINVSHVSMVFNMASEKLTNLKEYFIAIMKRSLFFEGFSALDDINFKVKKGDVFGILGTNGSGKSTLLKIVAGVLSPTSGKSTVKGNISPLIELGAGFDVELSARENIYLNGALLGYSKEFINDHFDEIVDFAEIERFLDMPLKNYSSGMVARIAFSIATVMIPDVLIVDEVLSVGDFMFQKKCEDRISELIDKHGVTVLIVSHSNDQIERLCNKAIWIEKGHMRMQGSAKEVCNAYRVLGGREVKQKSEQLVFDILQKAEKTEIDSNQIRFIGGDDYISTAIQLAWDGWKLNEIENVILVPSYTHTFCTLAYGIAGTLNAPVIPFNCEDIISSIDKGLASLNPGTVYILADPITIDSILKNEMVTSRFQKVVPIPIDQEASNIKKDLLDFGIKNQLWKNCRQIIFVHFEDYAAAFSIASYAYKEHIPILIFFDNENEIDTSVLQTLNTLNVCEILACGRISGSPLVAEMQKRGFDTIVITDDSDSITNLSATKWLEETGLYDQEKIIVGPKSPIHWQNLINAPSYSAKKSIPLLLEDTYDLDDVASCLKFASQYPLSQISIVGRDSFNLIDAKLLLEATDNNGKSRIC